MRKMLIEPHGTSLGFYMYAEDEKDFNNPAKVHEYLMNNFDNYGRADWLQESVKAGKYSTVICVPDSWFKRLLTRKGKFLC
jgi:hypothetical protein